MDSIATTYLKFRLTLSEKDALLLTIERLQTEFEKLNLQVDYLTKDNSRLELQKATIKSQLDIKDKIHEADIMYYKEKAKGKLTSFLLGTATGALIVAILTLL